MSRVAMLVLLTVAGICAPNAVRAQAAEELRAAERARLRALVEADMETARRLHAEDFQLITPTGGVVLKDEYLRLVATGEVDYLLWEPGDISVRLYEASAVIRYKAELAIRVRGMPDAPSGWFWHTDVYEQRNGQWQVVWSQATQIK